MTNTKKQRNISGLKPFKPGQSGNPKGRPRKDVSLTSMVKNLLEDVPELMLGGKKNTMTWRELIVRAWLVGSYKGNATMFTRLIERVEGKVALPITGGKGEPLVPPVVRFHFADGTVIVPPRNGHKPMEAVPGGNGDKTGN